MYKFLLQRFFALAVLCLLTTSLKAQLIPSGYVFTRTVGTYSTLGAGETIVATGSALFNQTYPVSLPFTFRFDNVDYNDIYVAVNGFISFGTTNPGSGYYMINSSSTGFRVATALGGDLESLNSSSKISYQTLGTAPNRTFVIQWSGLGYTGSTSLSTNFQIRLSETTHKVAFQYGANTLLNASSQVDFQIGLRGINNTVIEPIINPVADWNTLLVGTSNTDVFTYYGNVNPPSGLTLTFTPPSPCATPGTPASLTLTAGNTNISGTFPAAVPTPSKYLVVRTPGTTALNTPPVSGTSYTPGAPIGNGTVVSVSATTGFNNTGLTTFTTYTYTVFAFNEGTCNGSPYYSPNPISANAQTVGPRSYTWIPTSGSGSFATASNWNPARVSTDTDDTLIFSNGGTVTVTNVPTQTVKRIEVGGNTQVTFNSAASATLTIKSAYVVSSGSSHTLDGATPVNIQFSTGALNTIDGTTTIANASTVNVSNGATSVTGTLSLTGASALLQNTGAQTNLIFQSGSVYTHGINGGTIPKAIFLLGSTVNVTGVTNTVPTFPVALDFGNLTWNCTQQSALITMPGSIDTIRGNFTIASTNTFALRGGAGSATITILGNFIQTGGEYQISSSADKLSVIGEMLLSGGTLNLSAGSTTSLPTLFAQGHITQSLLHTITKTGSNRPILRFCGTAHQNITIGGTSGNVAVEYILLNPAGATLTGILSVGTGGSVQVASGTWDGSGYFGYSPTSSSLLYSGYAPIGATAVEWPAVNGPVNVTVELLSPAPTNRIHLPGNRTTPGTFTLNAGVLMLDQYNMTLAGTFTLPNSAGNLNRMFAADSTGKLIRPVTTNAINTAPDPYDFPLGNVRGTPAYSPLTFYVLTNPTARQIGFSVINAKHPNESSNTDFFERYWRISDNLPGTPFRYYLRLCTQPSDLHGSPDIALHQWTGSAWQYIPSNYYGPAPRIIGTTIYDSLSTTTFPLNGDFAARAVPVNTYSWTGATNTEFTEPGNWTPARNTPRPNDRLQFNSGNIDTCRNIATQHLSRLSFTNNTQAILYGGTTASTGALTIYADDDTASREFLVQTGSNVYLYAFLSSLRINFAQNQYQAKATIDGRYDCGYNTPGLGFNYINFDDCEAVIEPNGVIVGSGHFLAYEPYSSTTPRLRIKGTYEHNFKTYNGLIPDADWDTGSHLVIKGYTTIAFSGNTTIGTTDSLWNLTWNCPNQATDMQLSYLRVRGTMNVASTGTAQLNIGFSQAYNYFIGTYLQSAGTVEMGNGTVNNPKQLNFAGNFTQTGGVFKHSGTTATATLNFHSPAPQAITFHNAAPAGRIVYRFAGAAGTNLLGSGSLTTTFNINNGGGVRIATPAPITSALTLAYNPGGTFLRFDTGCTVAAPIWPAVNGPENVSLNLTIAGTVNLPFSRTISNMLTMAGGHMNISGNTLTLGTSSNAPGTMAWTTGHIITSTGGTFTRWFPTAGLPTSSVTTIGFFPLGTPYGSRRANVYFSSGTALSTGGTISMSHVDDATLTNGLSVADGAATLVSRSNAGWTVSTGNGLTLASASMGLRLVAGSLLGISNPANLRLMQANAVVGGHIAGSGTYPDYVVERLGISQTDMNSTFYAGSEGPLNLTYISVTNGNWNSGPTWNTGTVPPAGAPVIIGLNTTVSVTGTQAAKMVTVSPNSGLLISGGTLTLDSSLINNGTVNLSSGTLNIGPAAGGRMTLLNNDTLIVTGGNLNIGGNLVNESLSFFRQSAGTIRIDPNSGVGATSIPPGTPAFLLKSAGLDVTGGTTLIVDPHSGYSIQYTLTVPVVFAAAHTLQFGDGVSSTVSTNFGMDLGWVGSNLSLGNLSLMGSPGPVRNATIFSASSLVVGGNITLPNANARFDEGDQEVYLKGNLSVAPGSTYNMDNDGILAFTNRVGTANAPVTVPQTVGGGGAFNNVTNAGAFTNLSINNSSAAGVSFPMATVTVTGTLDLLKGVMNVNNGAGTVIMTTHFSNGVTNPVGWIWGKYQSAISLLSSFYAPVGDQNNPTVVRLMNVGTLSLGSPGTLRISATGTDHPFIASGPIQPSKSINRYFTIETLNNLSFLPGTITVSASYLTQDIDPGVNIPAVTARVYANSSWSNPGTTSPGFNTTTVSGMGAQIGGSYQFGEVIAQPFITLQPSPDTICEGNNASFAMSSSITGANYRWQLLSGSTWTSLTNIAPYSGTGTNTLNITAATLALNGNQYRCMVYTTNDTAYTTSVGLTVQPIVAPVVTIAANPGNTICAGANVTFTATPTNGGTTPAYQWKVNNTNVGTNSSTYSSSTLANNDVITCVLTSNAACLSTTTATSTGITMTVNPIIVPSVTVTANPGFNICPSTSVTFTANPVNGGASPSYQWKKNNVNVGTNSPTYTDAALVNGNTIAVVMTSNASCLSTTTATSPTGTISTSSAVTPSVTIAASPATTICAGTAVTFTATPVNGGTTPAYQWKKNNINVATGATYVTTTLANNDVITCELTTSLGCVTSTTAQSNAITMTVNPALTPAVSITAAPGTAICAGTSVQFTANVTNPGPAVSYQWQKNSINVGTGTTYTTTTLASNDVITLTITTTPACATTSTATSNALTMTVTPLVTPSVTIAAAPGATICGGTSVTFTATPVNGGAAPGYQWKKNNVNVGTGTTYTSATLANNDVITCELTSNATCASPALVTSNSITMSVTTPATPTISITASANPVCLGGPVTFTATTTNGGTTPSYQWKKNNVNVGTSSTTYTDNAIVQGDVIVCVLTSSLSCITGNNISSNTITMSTTTAITPAVSISAAPGNTICAGTSVTFTAAVTNPGPTVGYQWKVNNLNVGTNSTYSSSTLANNDVVTLVVTTTPGCATTSTATSNAITMTVNPVVTPSVSIAAAPGNSICAGTSVTFTATPVNGGTAPAYQWKKNSVNVGTGLTYTSNTLAQGDIITCEMTNNLACPAVAVSTSNAITMTVAQPAAPAVSIAAGSNPICAGVTVTFTATGTNGGAAPSYQWKKNNVNVGANSPTYTDPGIVQGDILLCVMTSSHLCSSGTTVTSNSVLMNVDPLLTPTAVISASPSTSIGLGTPVTFSAVITGGGPTPSYTWLLNNAIAGTSPTYVTSTLAEGDEVKLDLQSSDPCASPVSVTSNLLKIHINTAVPGIVLGGSAITVYPNPSAGVLRVRGDKVKAGEPVTLRLLNAQGALVFSETFTPVQSAFERALLLPATIANGTYFLQLRYDGESRSERLLLQR